MTAPKTSNTHRYLFWLSYDGTAYNGWQVQNAELTAQQLDLDRWMRHRNDGGPYPDANRPTVQAVVDAALSRLDNNPVKTYAASRTDAGVHALALFVHADMQRAWQPDDLRHALNKMLPVDIRVRKVIVPADPTLHARHDALAKRYIYRVINAPTISALEAHRCWHRRRPIDVEQLQWATQHLLSLENFAAYHRNQSIEVDTRLRLQRLDVHSSALAAGGQLLTIDVRGERFLHHMVRTLVAAMVAVGEGTRSQAQIEEASASGDRQLLPGSAPPGGLYLAATHVCTLGWWDASEEI